MLIVLGGTFGATMAGCPSDKIGDPDPLQEGVHVGRRPTSSVASRSSSATPRRPAATACSRSTSRQAIEDPFTRKGLQLVVDGTDPELVAEVLEAENEAMRKRHAGRRPPFEKAGGSRRRWASSAPSSASSTCWRTSTRRDARPVDLRRVHRDAARRRVGQRPLPAGGEPPQAALGGGAALPRDDARGDPLDPGRRQPARRRREALRVRAAAQRPSEGEQTAAAAARRSRPPELTHGRHAAARSTTTRSTRTRSAGSCRAST